MYSGKSDCNRVKVVVFGKVVVVGQSGCVPAKWLYSDKTGCIKAKRLCSGKSG